VAPASDLQRAYFSARIEDFLSGDDASVLGELTRRLVYTPPQEPAQIVAQIVALTTDLKRFINDDSVFDADPLIKMAVAHHQFESIHPFCDGNGRTGRIVNVPCLVNKGQLDIPVLYLSSQIMRSKPDYYRLLQAVRQQTDSAAVWQEWVLYMLAAVETTAQQTIRTVIDIKSALLDYKHRIRTGFKFYVQDLINNLFMPPYIRIEFVERDLKVKRLTAAKHLDALAGAGFVQKVKVGRSNCYGNLALNAILIRTGEVPAVPQ